MSWLALVPRGIILRDMVCIRGQRDSHLFSPSLPLFPSPLPSLSQVSDIDKIHERSLSDPAKEDTDSHLFLPPLNLLS